MSREVKIGHRALWNRPWGSNGVISHDGKLWWIDLACGLLFCDPFSDEQEEMQFVALPEGSETTPAAGDGEELAKYRCVARSAGSLRYVQIDPDADDATVALYTLSRPGTAAAFDWTCEFKVAFDQIWGHGSYADSPMPRRVPALALVDPTNAAVVYLFLITLRRSWIFAVDLSTKTTFHCTEYCLPNVPSREHSSRYVQPWVLPLSITRHSDEGKSCHSVHNHECCLFKI